MSQTSQATLRRVKRHDRWARWVVTFGGAIVIVSVLGILVLILGTTLPLFYPARARLLGEAALPASLRAEGVLGLGVQSAANDSWLVAHVVDSSGRFRFVDLHGKEAIDRDRRRPVGLDAAKGASAASSRPTIFALQTNLRSVLGEGQGARITPLPPGEGQGVRANTFAERCWGPLPAEDRPLRSAGRTARFRSSRSSPRPSSQARCLKFPQLHTGNGGYDPARQVGRARAGHPPPHGRRLVALRRAVPWQADRRHPSKRRSFRRQDAKRGSFSTKTFPGP